MIHQDKSAAEIADIMVGMMPAKPNPRSNIHDKPDLIAKKKRIRQMQYELEDQRIEAGDFEPGEFASDWSKASNARRNQASKGDY